MIETRKAPAIVFRQEMRGDKQVTIVVGDWPKATRVVKNILDAELQTALIKVIGGNIHIVVENGSALYAISEFDQSTGIYCCTLLEGTCRIETEASAA